MKHGRIKWFRPEELNEEQRNYYNALLTGPRGNRVVNDAGQLEGAFNARLLDPQVGNAIQELGAVLRFRTGLTAREREITILEVARSERCNFEWISHAEVARKGGFAEEQLEAIRMGIPVPDLSSAEQVAQQVARSLIEHRDLDDGLFAEAEQELGLVKLFDLVSLVGYYQATAVALRTWRVPLRAGSIPVFTEDS